MLMASSMVVEADVEAGRRIAGLGFKYMHPIAIDELINGARRVVSITEDARPNRTHLHTSRLQTLGDAVITPVAFVRCIIATESGGARIRNQ